MQNFYHPTGSSDNNSMPCWKWYRETLTIAVVTEPTMGGSWGSPYLASGTPLELLLFSFDCNRHVSCCTLFYNCVVKRENNYNDVIGAIQV